MIIAVDFDGVLCEDRFPEIGDEDTEMVGFVRDLIDAGHEVILWTSRVDDRLEEATRWCDDRGLSFCAVNANAPSNLAQYGTDPRKVYADMYVDDKVPFWSRLAAMMRIKNLLENEEVDSGQTHW